MDARRHWDRIYQSKKLDRLSWYRPHLKTSLALIERAASGRSAAIIDVGGGASTLVDDLTMVGYRNITVLDISQTALDIAAERLSGAAGQVRWICAGLTEAQHRPEWAERAYDVWHDRAVFHFLTSPEDRRSYVRAAASAVKIGGHLILGVFGPAGPEKCSGLDVVRYDAKSLQDEFGPRFRTVDSFREMHQTPLGTTQEFIYCDFTLDS